MLKSVKSDGYVEIKIGFVWFFVLKITPVLRERGIIYTITRNGYYRFYNKR